MVFRALYEKKRVKKGKKERQIYYVTADEFRHTFKCGPAVLSNMMIRTLGIKVGSRSVGEKISVS